MRIIKDRIGLSLLEIIIALLILSLVMYALTTLFVSSKSFLYHSGSRVTSMEAGKLFFEDSSLAVRADVTANCLQDSSACVNRTIQHNGIDYHVNYLTAPVPNSTGTDTTLRKVIINVQWNETR